jgi:hypothetical protein
MIQLASRLEREQQRWREIHRTDALIMCRRGFQVAGMLWWCSQAAPIGADGEDKSQRNDDTGIHTVPSA